MRDPAERLLAISEPSLIFTWFIVVPLNVKAPSVTSLFKRPTFVIETPFALTDPVLTPLTYVWNLSVAVAAPLNVTTT
jgi:hypothetical protein